MVTVPTFKSLITRFARSKILRDKPFQTVFQFAGRILGVVQGGFFLREMPLCSSGFGI